MFGNVPIIAKYTENSFRASRQGERLRKYYLICAVYQDSRRTETGAGALKKTLFKVYSLITVVDPLCDGLTLLFAELGLCRHDPETVDRPRVAHAVVQ